MQQEKGISYLFITHDLSVVAEIADDVAVMYKGKIVEYGSVEQVLTQPKEEYTKQLLSAVPVLKCVFRFNVATNSRGMLPSIPF